ncbi:hypothetical protein PFISCL1PPCAC_22693, partial [Pristionchus fissidentatus]
SGRVFIRNYKLEAIVVFLRSHGALLNFPIAASGDALWGTTVAAIVARHSLSLHLLDRLYRSLVALGRVLVVRIDGSSSGGSVGGLFLFLSVVEVIVGGDGNSHLDCCDFSSPPLGDNNLALRRAWSRCGESANALGVFNGGNLSLRLSFALAEASHLHISTLSLLMVDLRSPSLRGESATLGTGSCGEADASLIDNLSLEPAGNVLACKFKWIRIPYGRIPLRGCNINEANEQQ